MGGLESAGRPTGAPRFPCLDGVRALAALTVVLTHVGFQTGASLDGPAHSLLARFDVGVAIFFVLSGFLLHRPQALAALHGRPWPATVPYLWRRGLRVLPGLWLAVAAALLLVPQDDGVSASDWLFSLTATGIWVEGGTSQTGLTQLWSLGTEISFYLALPLLGRLLGRTLRRQLTVLAVLFAVGLLSDGLVGAEVVPPHWGYWLPAHLDWFSLGMALAALSAAGSRVLDEVADEALACWAGAAALFAVTTTPLVGPYGLSLLDAQQTVSRSLLYGLVAALLVLPAVAGDPARGPVRALLRTPVMVFLGRISYGVFLLHLVVLELARPALGVEEFGGSFLLVTAVVLAITVPVAWASLRLVEEPALRWKSRGPGRERARATG